MWLAYRLHAAQRGQEHSGAVRLACKPVADPHPRLEDDPLHDWLPAAHAKSMHEP
jgi:hypothetical protein